MDYSKVCYIPFHGLTIDPSGHVTFCCMDYPSFDKPMHEMPEHTKSRWFHTELIDEIEDLEEWWKKKYKPVWEDHMAGKAASCFPCSGCFAGRHRSKNTTVQESYQRNLESGKLKWEFDEQDPKIRFLEFTTSNVCNQMCVMCNYRFSTQWWEHSDDFNRVRKTGQKLVKLSDGAINKVKKILPQLSHVMIKGGEPLADMNNMHLLEELSEVNSDCWIAMTTNFQAVTQRHIDIFKKLPRADIYISIDGTDEIFNWIRGGDFKRVDENIKRFHGETGLMCQISVTTSMFNFFSTNRILEYFYQRPEIKYFHHHNVVSYPEWCNPRFLPEEIFEEQMVKNMNMGVKFGKQLCQFDKFFDLEHKPTPYPNYWNDVKNYVLKMNLIRGFDITDHVPELRAILQAI